MRKSDENSIARVGKKQTYFIKPENIKKLKEIKKETKTGYSNLVNNLIEEKYEEIITKGENKEQ